MQLEIYPHRMEDDPKWLDYTGQRKCNKCGNIKIHAHMKTDKRCPYGIQKICKDCDNTVWPKHKKRKTKSVIQKPSNEELMVARHIDLLPAHPLETPSGLLPHPATLALSQVDAEFGQLPQQERVLLALTKLEGNEQARQIVEKHYAKPKEIETDAQTALRVKMERDGFSAKVVDAAVKILPRILKELKEFDSL